MLKFKNKYKYKIKKIIKMLKLKNKYKSQIKKININLKLKINRIKK